jgi:phosphoribosylformimino-5-aminoimidazole carboxamide ribotide isomerase
VGVDRVIGAVDSKAARRHARMEKRHGTTAVEAVRMLEPYCGEFLYTHVDKEGSDEGTDIAAIRRVGTRRDDR